MTQNIYDNQAFFDGYAQLSRSQHGLDGARNGPPFAASCRIYRAKAWSISAAATAGFAAAREQGAADVLGLDVSEKCWPRRGR